MLSQSVLIERFSAGGTAGRASNLFTEGDVLYSYGHHFPLVVRRDWGAGVAYLVNADRYSISTAVHQRQCISRLTPNVQVPFSAFAAASLIDWDRLPRVGLRVAASRNDSYHLCCTYCLKDAVYDADRRGHCHADRSPLCPQADGKVASRHVLGAVVLAYENRCFLSSVDEQEDWRVPAYFLCELPHDVASVEGAFDALVPEEVREALRRGIEVRRQGDVFAIPSALATRQIPGPSCRGFRVFDTAHVVTEARVNGTVYIRGTLRHRPRTGRRQHRPLALGASWWVAVKNTAVASWNAVGQVD